VGQLRGAAGRRGAVAAGRRGVAGRRGGAWDVRPRVARRTADPGEAAPPTADRPRPFLRGPDPRHDPGRGPGRATRPAEAASREGRRHERHRSHRRRHGGFAAAGRLRVAQLRANRKQVGHSPVAAPADPAMVVRSLSVPRPATAWAHRPATARGRGRGSIQIQGRARTPSPTAGPIAVDPSVDLAAGRQILDSDCCRSPNQGRRFGHPTRERARVQARGLGPDRTPSRAAGRAVGRIRRRACLVDGQSHSYPITLPDASVGRHGCLPREPLFVRALLEGDPSLPSRAPFWRPLAGRGAPEAPRSARPPAPG
jgi:hypothetical protein